uniref:Retroviral polymerase SH3-like domain-containing protein n=1 Tax=Ananas comosus var. bracteatus TaxID=296719 RepID=A0A6V7P9H6_ANACO|nr:unnamed protein product [Ananas comosus var. bracteatus]
MFESRCFDGVVRTVSNIRHVPALRKSLLLLGMFCKQGLRFVSEKDHLKGYQLWDPTTHKIVISRDVVFNEGSFQGTKGKQDDEAMAPIEFFEARDEVNERVGEDGSAIRRAVTKLLKKRTFRLRFRLEGRGDVVKS